VDVKVNPAQAMAKNKNYTFEKKFDQMFRKKYEKFENKIEKRARFNA
jgi:hypothetical protein